MKFARYLHYILVELENRGLSDRIAMAEIFNEVGAIPILIGEFKNEDTSKIDFTKKHAEAILWLHSQHPNLLFAVDNDSVSEEAVEELPDTLQAFNGHNYFLWGVYGGTLEIGEPKRDDFFLDSCTPEDVADARGDLLQLTPSCSPWYRRIAYCNNLDNSKIQALNHYLTKRISENRDRYLENLDAFCDGYQKVMKRFPGIPVVCGEGVTYCSSQKLLWEEQSEEYWDLVKTAMMKYKKIGLWGTVIKTCCGPEDPCWELCKDRLKELNELFLSE